MKRYLQLFLLTLTTGLVLVGCEPDPVTLDPAPSKLDGINDTFSLVEVKQVDNNGIGLTELDVSGLFIGTTPAVIAFNSANGTWSYNTGSSLDFLGGSGSWAFDNDEYPTKIAMNNGTDNYDLTLVRTIRPAEQFLEVELTRPCGATGYRYKFARN
ncbi:MAG: hypothetical protein AAGN35_13595 [Bacteroidota bacterium]